MTADLRRPAAWGPLLDDPARLASLSAAERHALGEGLRDQFFALSGAGSARNADVEARFRALVERVVPAGPLPVVHGLSVWYHPTGQHRDVRFVDVSLLDGADPAVRDRFARPSAALPHLAAVFVDPEALSFRTFENIVPLDRWFEGLELDLKLGARTLHGRHDGLHAFSFPLVAEDAVRRALNALDTLELYAVPLNAASRGGRRYVFHAARLADALTDAVRAALPKKLAKGFVHVNPVFRCNRFAPDDAPFLRHLDTPYFDAAHRHVSRHTLLVYLTGGAGRDGAPILRLVDGEEQVVFDTVAPGTCVLFEQRHAHDGAPFAEGDKVFLRTELVFEDPRAKHVPGIAEVFAQATYMTGESVFAPELARWAHDCYDRAAAAHWKGLAARPPTEPFVHKRFRGASFVANGYDFWFPAGTPLETCAALVVLDTFNCVFDGQPFRKQCASEVVTGDPHDARWIAERLRTTEPAGEPVFARPTKAAWFPAPEAPDDTVCCPFHAWNGFDPTRCSDVVDLYRRAQAWAQTRIDPAPVLMLGQEVFLDPGRFRVVGNQIHVLTEQALLPVNFASCWNDGTMPPNYLDLDVTVQALHLLVPPILFHEDPERGLVRLSFDFFRNGWMVGHHVATVPIPRIRRIGSSEFEAIEAGEHAVPWVEAVPTAEVRPRKDAGKEPWWGWDSAIVRELYDEAGLDDDGDDDDDDDA